MKAQMRKGSQAKARMIARYVVEVSSSGKRLFTFLYLEGMMRVYETMLLYLLYKPAVKRYYKLRTDLKLVWCSNPKCNYYYIVRPKCEKAAKQKLE
jgi:hypothetical protein